ncbi:AraC family transcriptional regulator [Niabella terrae]
MKVLQFTIPIQHDKTIVSRVEILPHFYPYLHRHKEMQLTWVQQGHGTLVVDNNMHKFQGNDIFLIGANQPHVFKSSASYFAAGGSKQIRSLDMFFDPELINNTLLNIPECKPLRQFLNRSQTGMRIPEGISQAVGKKMQFISEQEGGLPATLQFIKLLHLLSSAPEAERLSASPGLRSNETESLRINDIYNYMLHNYEKNITLEDVAREAFMTPQAFCRFFKKHTGQTFISFLSEIRINEARKLFAAGNYDSISSVAYHCGFNSITNFNRVFKSVAKQSPSVYIEKLRQHIQLIAS